MADEQLKHHIHDVLMKDNTRYVKFVEWSDEDGCYIGSSPGLFYAGSHGDDEHQVFEELCQIV